MPENQKSVFTAGSHAAHHKGIGRDQEDTENRQDKEGEKEIDHTSQQDTAKDKSLGFPKKKDKHDCHFQKGGHGNTSCLGKSRVADNPFIGLANEKTDRAAK